MISIPSSQCAGCEGNSGQRPNETSKKWRFWAAMREITVLVLGLLMGLPRDTQAIGPQGFSDDRFALPPLIERDQA